MTKRSPFPNFQTSPEVIRLAVMLYVPFPLSISDVQDLAQVWHRKQPRVPKSNAI